LIITSQAKGGIFLTYTRNDSLKNPISVTNIQVFCINATYFNIYQMKIVEMSSLSSYAILCSFVIIAVYLYFFTEKRDEIEELLPEAKHTPHKRENELFKRIQRRLVEKTIVV